MPLHPVPIWMCVRFRYHTEETRCALQSPSLSIRPTLILLLDISERTAATCGLFLQGDFAHGEPRSSPLSSETEISTHLRGHSSGGLLAFTGWGEFRRPRRD